VLRWILDRGFSLNTMSSHQEHIAANFDITDFTLSHIDMAAIDHMQAIDHRVVDHNPVRWAPDWD
jgi:2,5-diketo-D-gluconate reductase B